MTVTLDDVRRAAELFRAATRELDPQGAGWNLRDLRVAGKRAAGTRGSRHGGASPTVQNPRLR